MPSTAFAQSVPLRARGLAPRSRCTTAPVPRRPRRAIPSSVARDAPPPASPPPPSDPPPAPEDVILPGTPCFTPHILASPMPLHHRHAYLSAATAAVDAYLAAPAATRPPVAQLVLLVPQLNPALDVYDRRFLLQLTWAVARATAAAGLSTRVLVQGRRVFGAIPLSINGLRRNFDADLALTEADWPVALRSGELEVASDTASDDDAFVVTAPTNAVSIPVISAVRDLVDRAAGRPVILVNPRLDDVPSHSGVMQVSGRAARLAFLAAIEQAFYLRLLYAPGARFPPRGILYRAKPGPWQVWRALDVDADYRLILEADECPTPDRITQAFKADAFRARRQRLETEDAPESGSLDGVLKSVFKRFF